MAEITYLEAIREALVEEMERDANVLCLGEDVGVFGGAFKVTEGLQARFGENRVIDTPISEIAIVGAAAGAAHMGLRPVAEMQFADFISCAYDMLTNYVATSRYRTGLACPMVVRGPSGGYVRGGPFHSQNPEAAFVHTPGLKIVCPATAEDAKGLLKSAIRDDDCVLFFEHKYLYRRIKGVMPAGDHLTPIGRARVAREGKDLSIITYGATVWKAIEAADQLAQTGVSVEVIDLRTLAPLDDDSGRLGVWPAHISLYSTPADIDEMKAMLTAPEVADTLSQLAAVEQMSRRINPRHWHEYDAQKATATETAA